ncbi:MAG: SAM-dependent methyltransferase [Bacteroidales bacterium]|nr:SAM-dependent methyltransferase [Bacteroidales bacterium]
MASLYLFPTLLADVDWKESIPAFNVEKILQCECFIVEELRTARRFLRKIGYAKDFDAVEFQLLNEHTKEVDISDLLDKIEKENKDIFLLSEAGLPCVADPGASAVALAQRKNIKVVPLVGPSSIYMSLMASGFNGQNFAFNGYLPIKEDEKHKKLRLLEERAYRENQTQIFIEAPYRNDKLLSSLLKILRSETMLCVATDITSESQSIKTKTISQWKKERDFVIGKRNTVFLIYHS